MVWIQTLGQSNQPPAGNRWHDGDQGAFDDAVDMEEAEQGPKGRDRQLRRAATLSPSSSTSWKAEPSVVIDATLRRSSDGTRRCWKARP